MRTVGEFESIADIENTVVRSNDLSRSIRIKDIAKVSLDFKDVSIGHRLNGKEAVRLVVMKKENADAITLIDDLKQLIDKDLNKDKIRNVDLEYINDMSIFIRRRLGVLSNNLAVGLLLVIIVLSIFSSLSCGLDYRNWYPFFIFGSYVVFPY